MIPIGYGLKAIFIEFEKLSFFSFVIRFAIDFTKHGSEFERREPEAVGDSLCVFPRKITLPTDDLRERSGAKAESSCKGAKRVGGIARLPLVVLLQ